jgi:hypothetical protein
MAAAMTCGRRTGLTHGVLGGRMTGANGPAYGAPGGGVPGAGAAGPVPGPGDAGAAEGGGDGGAAAAGSPGTGSVRPVGWSGSGGPSSGRSGELLGVVMVRPPLGGEVPEAMRPVNGWAMNPLWTG